MPEQLDHAAGYSLVSPVPKRDGRTLLVGDPPVGAAENQNLNQLLEDHPVGYTRAVTAQGVGHLSFGQEGYELFEDGLDDVRWECGHGNTLLVSLGKLGNSARMIEHPVPAFHMDA